MTELELDNESLKIVDYILNYQPSDRIDYFGIDNHTLEGVIEKGIVQKVSKRDRYGISYTILQINPEFENIVKNLIRNKINELYPQLSEDLMNLFLDIDFSLFIEFYDRSTQQKELSISSWEKQDRCLSLWTVLQKSGIGFIRQYTTTTKNTYIEFIYRTFPFETKSNFLELAKVVIQKKVTEMTDEEKWVTYLRNYFSYEDTIIKNRTHYYSENVIKNALEKVRSKGAFTFIEQDIKNTLMERISQKLSSDLRYLSILELLSSISQKSNDKYVVYQNDIDKLPYNVNITLKNYINDLINEGLVLTDSGMFILTPQMKTVLANLEKRTRSMMISVDSHKRAEYALATILKETKKEIKILDSYFDGRALVRIFSHAPHNVRVLILFRDDEKKNSLNAQITNIKSELANYEIRQIKVSEEKLPHDRFIIIDNKIVWQLGASVNNLGEKFSTAFSHSEEYSPIFIKYYDTLWNDSEIFFPM